MKSLQTSFLDQLATICDAESRYAESLGGWITSSEYPSMDILLETLLREAEGHVSVIEYVFASFVETPRRLRCDPVAALIRDHSRGQGLFGRQVPDREAAMMITIERIKNYKMAVYFRLYRWAGLFRNERAAPYLFELLDEEKRSLPPLETISWNDCNQQADSDQIRERIEFARPRRDEVICFS